MRMAISSNKILSIVLFPIIEFVRFLGREYPVFLVKIRYFFRFKKKLDLDNPKTLNEKILYQSLKTDCRLRTQLTDKWKVRKYVEDCGLSDILVELYGVWGDANDIDFEQLPANFVLKPNHGSGNVIFIKDKHHINESKIKNTLNKDLRKVYGELEGGVHYYDIDPVVIAEELLLNDSISEKYSSSIIDYKIWCFNGKAYYIWTCSNRNKYSTEVMTYDRQWNRHPEFSVFNEHYKEGDPLPMPKSLEKMLYVAEILSKPFSVVRVDLYNIEGKIYFGEMTFTSLGGMMDFYTQEFQNHAGSLIKL